MPSSWKNAPAAVRRASAERIGEPTSPLAERGMRSSARIACGVSMESVSLGQAPGRSSVAGAACRCRRDPGTPVTAGRPADARPHLRFSRMPGPAPLDRVAVETTQVLVLSDGRTPADVANRRGHVFEKFIALLLTHYGYSEPRTEDLNVVSDGIELDV